MTKAQVRIFNRLRKKQVNRKIDIVEATEQFVTFHIPFPGLYVTYDSAGTMLSTETEAERKAGNKAVLRVPFAGEMGSDMPPVEPIPLDDDDDVPF
jgi:hypothetical protein